MSIFDSFMPDILVNVPAPFIPGVRILDEDEAPIVMHLPQTRSSRAGWIPISVKPSDILNKWVGESERIVSGLFTLARRLKPCIIFMGEIDSLFGACSLDGHSPWRNNLITQFAQEMDGICSLDVVVIGTTNRSFDLDNALLRRLSCRILIELPDEAAREALD
ncbi:hypothetical protein RSAG8_12242, partial [Rhizoctonia solani AG-8 WAC10335]